MHRDAEHMHDATYAPPASLEALRRRGLLVGGAGLVASLGGFVISPGQFYHSYLLAYLFWLAAAMGGLALTMLQHMSGGSWGVMLRRILEAAARTLPWMAILFLPIAIGAPHLYPWTDAAAVAADPVLTAKSAYLNLPFFYARAVGYFAIWCSLAFFLTKWSADQDATGSADAQRKMKALSAIGLVIYALTMTFASIDWGMSLEPHWFSTMYGFLFIGGQALMGLSVAIVTVRRLSREAPMAGLYTKGHLHDLGKLLFAFTMLWAYLSFSQFLIIWSANLPEEIPWYLHRMRGGWEAIGVGLMVCHFAVPFVVLINRSTKRNLTVLGVMALWMIAMRYLDLFYIIGPEAYPDGLRVHWLDLSTVVGVGGIWVSAFASNLMSRPLLPLRDPELASALQGPAGH